MTLKSPSEITTMAELRGQIDHLDRELVALLALRQVHIDRAAQIKPNEGMPARITSRVDDVLNKVSQAAAEKGFDPDLARSMWAQMIEAMIAREERVLGPDK
nr:chorismate mutase [uncultured Celeribacter sp.]